MKGSEKNWFTAASLLASGLETSQALVAKSNGKETKRPNIIYIMTDDHSYQTTSAYGGPISKIVQTPKNWRTSLYYHYYDYSSVHVVRKHDGVRTDRYKLIHFYGEGGVRGAKTVYQTTPGNREHMAVDLLSKTNYITDDLDLNCNELYDLEKDPQELNNLYGKSGYEKITAEMQAKLDKYRKDLKVDEY